MYLWEDKHCVWDSKCRSTWGIQRLSRAKPHWYSCKAMTKISEGAVPKPNREEGFRAQCSCKSCSPPQKVSGTAPNPSPPVNLRPISSTSRNTEKYQKWFSLDFRDRERRQGYPTQGEKIDMIWLYVVQSSVDSSLSTLRHVFLFFFFLISFTIRCVRDYLGR